ncbi:hypothetical protein FHR49_001280 [Xanthomonas campestris]
MDVLDDYLALDKPPYALLLKGPWGIGKSFYWNAYAKSGRLRDKKAITISVAGLSTLDELSAALFQASISYKNTSTLVEAGTVLGKAALRFLKIEPTDITLNADIRGGKSVICFDDIERFSGQVQTLFGFIINLIDADRVHCILITDEDRAIDAFGSNYTINRERIIGKTLQIQSNVKGFIEETIANLYPHEVRQKLLDLCPEIIDLVSQKSVKNLRTIRSFLREVERIISNAKPNYEVNLSPLLGAILFWTVATARSPKNTKIIAKTFLVGGANIAMSIAMRRYNRDEKFDDDEIPILLDLLTETSFNNDYEDWKISPQLSRLILSDEADFSILAEEWKLKEIVQNKPKSLEVAHRLYRYWELKDSEVQGLIDTGLHIINNRSDKSLVRIFQLYRALNYMVELNLTTFDSSELSQLVREMLEDLGSRPADLEDTEVDYLMGALSPDEEEIHKITIEINDHVELLQAENSSRKAIHDLVFSTGDLPDIINDKVFRNANALEYYSKLREAGPSAAARTNECLRKLSRISNAAEYLTNELNFFSDLNKIILSERSKKTIPLSVLDAELAQLGKQLRTVIDKFALQQ